MVGNRNWTKEEFALMCALFAEGKTEDEVAEQLGRTVSAVRIKRSLRCGRKKLYRPKRQFVRDHYQEMTIKQMAEATGVSLTTVWQWCAQEDIKPLSVPYHKAWSTAELDLLRDSRGKLKFGEIARLLPDRSESAIRMKASNMGISLRCRSTTNKGA